MKTITLIFGVMVLCSGFIQNVKADPPVNCDVTVVGQNDPAVDRSAVQAAVNGPHSTKNVTVCLEGTFDFGGTGSVLISPPTYLTKLTITGILDDGGNHATINNGQEPFLFFDSGLPDLTIENLRFVNPGFSAISIYGGNKNIKVSHVEIEGVKTTFGARFGIFVLGILPFGEGNLIISDNAIQAGDYSSSDLTIDSIGIFVISELFPGSPPFNAKVSIENNTLKDWSGIGIYNSGPDNSLIKGNFIEPGEIANKGFVEWLCTGNGIAISHSIGSLIQNNNIHKVANTYVDGGATHCTIGIFIGNDSYHNTFLANNISGVGHVGIDVVAPGAGPANDNVFIGNNLTGFDPYIATIGLARTDPFFPICDPPDPPGVFRIDCVPPSGTAENNTFVGSPGTVTGNTDGNTITGLTPIAGGVGGEVSDAVSGM